jgi:UDP-2-acetamido-3-amino-2,3-dideoxy-glucuronate N-acetyltransferase
MFIHRLADVSSTQIGQGTKVWQFAVVFQGAVVGRDCNICAHSLIENNVIVGDRVTVKSGVYLWAGTRIGNDVFIGPNATFTNDPFPRSKQYPAEFVGVVVDDGASIGANATLLPGIRIGKGAMVGAGAVVTKDVQDWNVVAGNPAQVIRVLKQAE